MNWTEILLIEWITPAGIKIAVGPLGIILGAFPLLLLAYRYIRYRGLGWDIVEAQIDIRPLA